MNFERNGLPFLIINANNMADAVVIDNSQYQMLVYVFRAVSVKGKYEREDSLVYEQV